MQYEWVILCSPSIPTWLSYPPEFYVPKRLSKIKRLLIMLMRKLFGTPNYLEKKFTSKKSINIWSFWDIKLRGVAQSFWDGGSKCTKFSWSLVTCIWDWATWNSTMELLGLPNVANVDSRVVLQRIMCNQPIDKKHTLSLNSPMKCKQRKKKWNE